MNTNTEGFILSEVAGSRDPRILNATILSMMCPKEKDLFEIKKAHRDLENYHNNPDKYKNLTTKEKGDLLENFIKKIIDSIEILESLQNNLTAVNEIDNLIKLNQMGRIFKGNNFGTLIPEWFPDILSCECKNYTTKMNVEKINKFHSVLKQHKNNLGIFFAYLPLRGEQPLPIWRGAYGLVKKLSLIHMYKPDEPMIIFTKKEDYQDLEKRNYNLIEWIIDLRIKLLNDTKKSFLEDEEEN